MIILFDIDGVLIKAFEFSIVTTQENCRKQYILNHYPEIQNLVYLFLAVM